MTRPKPAAIKGAKGARKAATPSRRRGGHLIVFEGPDGVGKSTISAGVAMALRAAGIDCLQLSFPGREPGTLGGLVYGLHHDSSAHGIVDLSSTARQALHV